VPASRATLLLLEELAANAVAATTVQLVDGWLLRAWPEAPFRRCNSVLAIRGDARGLDARIALAEEFYRRHDLPARFQIGAVIEPAELEPRLAARGYEIEAPVFVQTARTGDVVRATAVAVRGDRGIEIAERPDAAFAEAAAAGHDTERGARHRVLAYCRLLARLGPRGAAAIVRDADGTVAGTGFVVAERGWAGVFGMGTRPELRRRRVATLLLHALAEHAASLGAQRLYLQVEADNVPALALYAHAGFDAAYGYHYRSLGLAPR
jgi:ribosomal protein S18 acetylase RimI-like enzyme